MKGLKLGKAGVELLAAFQLGSTNNVLGARHRTQVWFIKVYYGSVEQIRQIDMQFCKELEWLIVAEPINSTNQDGMIESPRYPMVN